MNQQIRFLEVGTNFDFTVDGFYLTEMTETNDPHTIITEVDSISKVSKYQIKKSFALTVENVDEELAGSFALLGTAVINFFPDNANYPDSFIRCIRATNPAPRLDFYNDDNTNSSDEIMLEETGE